MEQPVPDGYLRVETCNYDSLNDIDQHATTTTDYPFREMRWHKPEPYGLVIKLPKQYITIPWHNIVSYDIVCNSDEYVEANRQWRIQEEEIDG